MRMAGVLLRPAWMIAVGRVSLVLGHVVSLLCVWGIGRIGRTGRGNRRIYRYLCVRLHVWWVMMVILLPIVQRHGRTCCLCHTRCGRVAVMMLLLVMCVLLSGQVLRVQIGRTRRGWIDSEIRVRGWRVGEGCRSHVLLRGVLRSRCGICG